MLIIEPYRFDASILLHSDQSPLRVPASEVNVLQNTSLKNWAQQAYREQDTQNPAREIR